MKKYVIYRMSDLKIIRLQDDCPEFKSLSSDEDFDTTANILTTDLGKIALAKYLSK